MSKGENFIEELLIKSNLKFEREKIFDGLVGLNRMPLRFDFIVYNDDNSIKGLIEADGIQHYKFFKRFYKTFKDFNRAKEWDRKKNRFCLARKYKLYRIPYWEEANLKTADDIFQDKYLVKNQWHSDLLIQSLKDTDSLPRELKG